MRNKLGRLTQGGYACAFWRKAVVFKVSYFVGITHGSRRAFAIFERGIEMRLIRLFGFVFIFLFAARLVSSASTDPKEVLPTPVLRSVEPDSVKAGDAATVVGENLDKSRVAELYMTNGTVDVKVQMIEQTAAAIKFKVPAKVAPGRYNMMVLLVGEPPRLIEEPARVTVVE